MKGLPVSEAVLIVSLTQPGRPDWFLPLSGYPGPPGPANPVIWGTGWLGVLARLKRAGGQNGVRVGGREPFVGRERVRGERRRSLAPLAVSVQILLK